MTWGHRYKKSEIYNNVQLVDVRYLFSMGLELNWFKPLNLIKILNLFDRSIETLVLQFKFDFAKPI